MIAEELYKRLDMDFDIENSIDDWSFMAFNDYITPEFKSRYIGLVLDNSKLISKVYTSTFPDNKIIESILASGEEDVLLFSHHAMGYNAGLESFPFYNISKEYLEEMKRKRISFYVLHAPLDKNGKYSTAISLAKALNLEIAGQFCNVNNNQVGVICKTEIESVSEFAEYVRKLIGHDIKLREYGDSKIKNGLAAIVAGGGSYPFVAQEVAELGINLFLTGFTRPLPHFEPTMEFHRIARNNLINVIGATHYSTENYACIAMVSYFNKLGLESEFIPGKYYLEDL